MEKIKSKSEKILNPQKNKEDIPLDLSLRPQRLSEFIGQEKLKKNLEIFIAAAKKRNEVIEHILFCGGPGLGKTTLALIIAQEIGAKIRITSGSAIERAGDLAAILTNLQEGEILFIDEIHRLNPLIEEVLYPSMEEYKLDLVVGRGPMAETLRIELPPFTLIGATTKPSLLTSPLRDRFGVNYSLDFYVTEDLEKIVARSAKILNLFLEPAAIKEIAKRSRRTPRVANRLLKRVRDYAQVKEKEKIDLATAKKALNLLEVDDFGLTPTDRKLLKIIIEKFNGGPTGIKTLAAALGEEEETLEEIYEPYLIRLGFLDRTPRGRVVTQTAKKYFGQPKQTLL